MEITPQPEMVPTDPHFAPAIVSEVKKQVADQLVGQPGWRVVSVNQNGADIDVLNEVPGKPAPSITISLDRNVQNAAQDAVNMVGRKAMIVAIKPSTGEILAVAQNAAADVDGPTATMPCARRRATGLSASTCASAAPLAAVLITMSVAPKRSRMSNTGTPCARNAAL